MPQIGEHIINLAGTLPSEKRCGLATIYDDLVKRGDQIRFAVIAFDVISCKVFTDPGEEDQPTVRIKRWEVAEGTDAQAVLDLIDAINSRREGSDAEQPTLATAAELEAREAEAKARERDEADAAASGGGEGGGG